ncbi:hypothetical protein I551_8594 [Mycobacterium ulcerans str. Harvey]|uniref:Uncharacterized protein n=1 Tax=Mycobacterium ulcerans str. Harvey TaxID=1299332 RepID=A0ABN0RAC5_MYCUL|nr:hypothetical protein I551_8594 [Mycobacterium ulcerans str. Harvey]
MEGVFRASTTASSLRHRRPSQRLHVHLEISPAHPEVFAIRVAPACFFPAGDRALLARSPTAGTPSVAESPR